MAIDKFVKDTLLKISDDVGGVKKEIVELRVGQVRIEDGLAEHMRRTAINEENIDLIREKHAAEMKNIHTQIAPLKAHAAMWGVAGKIVAIVFSTLVGAAGIAAAVYEIWLK